jgi:hypothetical protein
MAGGCHFAIDLDHEHFFDGGNLGALTIRYVSLFAAEQPFPRELERSIGATDDLLRGGLFGALEGVVLRVLVSHSFVSSCSLGNEY